MSSRAVFAGLLRKYRLQQAFFFETHYSTSEVEQPAGGELSVRALKKFRDRQRFRMSAKHFSQNQIVECGKKVSVFRRTAIPALPILRICSEIMLPRFAVPESLCSEITVCGIHWMVHLVSSFSCFLSSCCLSAARRDYGADA